MKRRSFAWAMIALAMLAALVGTPAFAEPTTPGGVPDPGVPPVATGPLVSGTGGSVPTGAQTATPVVGPMARQILTQRAQVEALGERLTKLDLELSAATQARQRTWQAWQDAREQASALQRQADSAATKAYKQATQLGPLGGYANDIGQLNELVPGGLGIAPDSAAGSPQSAVLDAASAAALERSADTAYQAALAAEQQLTQQQATLRASHDQQTAALADLMARNAAAVQEAAAAQDAVDAQLAGQFAPGSNVGGLGPSAVALAAVAAARSKLGSPYVWGTEGPNTFDCSGLVWWAYGQAGYHGLPRVAADQYNATTPVSTTQLLVGDLLFFSTSSRTDWTTISHVGIYYGGDFMIEAPNSGDVVKVAHIWWSAFFGATRVVGPVPAPAPAPSHQPPPPPPKPSPSPLPSVVPPPKPSPSPSPSPSGSPTPSPSTSPSAPPPASPSAAASASTHPTPTPTPSTSRSSSSPGPGP